MHEKNTQDNYKGEKFRDEQQQSSFQGWSGPVTYTLPRDPGNDGYGFTLRYFVVYPPTPQALQSERVSETMEIISFFFVDHITELVCF